MQIHTHKDGIAADYRATLDDGTEIEIIDDPKRTLIVNGLAYSIDALAAGAPGNPALFSDEG